MTLAPEPRLPWLAPVALACAIGVLAALVGLEPLGSPDYGWHLETGELIAVHGVTLSFQSDRAMATTRSIGPSSDMGTPGPLSTVREEKRSGCVSANSTSS